MARFRFSISGLLAVVLAAGLASSAMRSPTEAWANGAFSVAVLALGIAVLGALFRQGPDRAYWSGFALLGWGYMLLAFGPWCDTHIAPLLITKTICEYLHFHLGSALPSRPYIRQIPGAQLFMFGYQQIGHSLSALLLGLLGGVLARRFSAPSREPDAKGGMGPGPTGSAGVDA